MASTRFTPSKSEPILCSKNPRGSFFSTDVSTNPSCICPSGQSQISKKMGKEKLFKCEVTKNSNVTLGSSKICSKTPLNSTNASNWKGLSTDSKCNCPYPLVQRKNNINNNTYYTCSYN